MRPGEPMVPWPTVDDLRVFLGSSTASPHGHDCVDNDEVFTMAVETAINLIASMCGLASHDHLDAEGATCKAECPKGVRLATLMWAARLYERRKSVMGASIGGGDGSYLLRSSALDGDILAMLTPYRLVGLM